jgi:TonB family protein
MVKAAFYLAACYLVYSLLLSKDTMYGRNRMFILLSLMVSFILPFITIQTGKPINLPVFGKTLSEVLISVNGSGSVISTKTGIDTSKVIFIIYLTGLLIFGIKLLTDFLELVFLIIRKKSGVNHLIKFSGLNTAGFSALGFVFINSRLTSEEAEEILKHEQNHLEKYHFFDIMLIETIKVFQWFNPFIHLFNRSLRAVHEFQADEGCLNTGIPVVSYQRLMMNQVLRSDAFTITNSFSYPTLIKKRMIMMTKERTTTLANLKLLMILPVIAIVMIAFSACGGKTKPTESNIEEIAPPPPPPPPPTFTVQNGDTTWNVVEKMPVFTGGDAALLKFIAEKTKYPDAAKTEGTQGKVIVRFVVTENGEVNGASIFRGVSPELDAEALRVVSSLPKFENPGIQDGKPVSVWYMIPITFALK